APPPRVPGPPLRWEGAFRRPRGGEPLAVEPVHHAGHAVPLSARARHALPPGGAVVGRDVRADVLADGVRAYDPVLRADDLPGHAVVVRVDAVDARGRRAGLAPGPALPHRRALVRGQRRAAAGPLLQRILLRGPGRHR